MNLKNKLAVAIVMAGSMSAAQATSYDVNALFSDAGVQGETYFNGSFDFNSVTNEVTGFTGMLSEAMWEWNPAAMNGMGDWSATMMTNNGPVTMGMQMMEMNKTPAIAAGTSDDLVYSQAYGMGDAPLLNLMYDIDSVYDANTGLVTATVFLQSDGNGNADTNVVANSFFDEGGYDVAIVGPDAPYGSTKYGYSPAPGSAINENAFFQMILDTNDLTNTSSVVTGMTYGDCTALGLMGDMLDGNTCMTGKAAGGSMGAVPSSLAVSVSAVPVPAAAWLFGGALMSLFGANRRKTVMPA